MGVVVVEKGASTRSIRTESGEDEESSALLLVSASPYVHGFCHDILAKLWSDPENEQTCRAERHAVGLKKAQG